MPEEIRIEHTPHRTQVEDALAAVATYQTGRLPMRGPGWIGAVIAWGVIFFVLLAAMRIFGAGSPVVLMVAVVVGVAVGVIAMGRSLARSTDAAFARLAEQVVAEGPCEVVISAETVRQESAGRLQQVTTQQVEAVLPIDGGLVLVAAGMGLLLPDAGLPEGMSRDALVETLEQWVPGLKTAAPGAGA